MTDHSREKQILNTLRKSAANVTAEDRLLIIRFLTEDAPELALGSGALAKLLKRIMNPLECFAAGIKVAPVDLAATIAFFEFITHQEMCN